ncbi:MAG: hypothetical protein J7501_09110 [Bdellovibrio sp.]|nr:hypothetical protein [Bdellovibrio sp.]
MIDVSAKARVLTSQTIIEPQIILEIEGMPLLGATKVYKIPKFGDEDLYFGKPGLVFGDTIEDSNALNLIDLKSSTQNITQQLNADKGMAASASSFTADIVDADEIITRYLSPGVEITDLLGAKANVYLNHGRGAHPEDSIPILIGVVDDIDSGVGSVKIKISHPEGIKRQQIFTQIKGSLVEEYLYRKKVIQGISYQTRDTVTGGLVTVTYISGATAKGQEVVTVVNNNITVKIHTDTTASNIVSKIKASQDAVDLVDAKIPISENQTLLQVPGGPWTLDSSTTLVLDSTQEMLLPSLDGTFETYVQIEDEVFRYTGIEGNTLTGITPGQFETIPKSHDLESETSTVYRLIGSMKEVALKTMMSKAKELSGIKALSVNYIDPLTLAQNALIFEGIDVATKYCLSVGDLASTTLSAEAGNNFSYRTILTMATISAGSYIVVDGPALTTEQGTDALVSFKSKYDVWPDGLGMQIDQVDVKEHEELEALFPSALHDYDFRLKDTISGDDFIEKQVYRPSSCYSIPRKGRASIGLTKPPIAQAETVVIDETNIVEPSKLRVKRSLTNNFFNSVVYKFEKDVIEDKFTRGVVSISTDSINRIPNVKNTPMVIEAEGVRDEGDTRAIIDAQTKRIFDRYQFGAESISGVQILYKDGHRLDVGDTVIFGSPKLKISDSTQGNRKFRPRVMEVVNIAKGPLKATVVADLLNTAYSAEAKYGVVSPSSETGSGSTTQLVKIKRSFSTPVTQLEQYKWKTYFGQKIVVRSPDWVTVYETDLIGFTDQDPNTMKVSPPLPGAPGEDWVVECPAYQDNDEMDLWKTLHVFLNPQIKVVTGISTTKIQVPPEDIGKFYVGSPVRIHAEDYSVDSKDVDNKVKEIDLIDNVIALARALEFTPAEGYLIDLVGFPDRGAPYRLL